MAEKPAQWQAYCFTCQKRISDPWPMESLHRAYGERHLRENPGHKVLLGFLLDEAETDSTNHAV